MGLVNKKIYKQLLFPPPLEFLFYFFHFMFKTNRFYSPGGVHCIAGRAVGAFAKILDSDPGRHRISFIFSGIVPKYKYCPQLKSQSVPKN